MYTQSWWRIELVSVSVVPAALSIPLTLQPESITSLARPNPLHQCLTPPSCPVHQLCKPVCPDKQLSSQCPIALNTYCSITCNQAGFGAFLGGLMTFAVMSAFSASPPSPALTEGDSNQDWVVHCTITKWLQGLQNAFTKPFVLIRSLFPWYLLFLQTSSSSSSTTSAPPPLHQQIKPLFFLATHSSSWLQSPPCIPHFPRAKAGCQSFEKKILHDHPAMGSVG